MNKKIDEQSVTVVITRRPVEGREKEYIEWVAGVSETSALFPGHLGATLQGPIDGEYHIVFRFDTVENLRNWENSAERGRWIRKLVGLVEGEDRVERFTGLEFLFDTKVAVVKKHKMAVVLTVVVFTMLGILRPIIATLIPEVPATVQLLCTVIIQVLAMTYVVMPMVTRVLGKWLHGR